MNITGQFVGLLGTHQSQSLNMPMPIEFQTAVVACSCHSIEMMGVERLAYLDYPHLPLHL